MESEMNERTCIVTRRGGDPEGLIRFVVGPDSSVVPDLKRNLPGRGCWVTAERSHVEKAAGKNLFARAFRSSVAVPPDLAEMVERQLARAALGASVTRLRSASSYVCRNRYNGKDTPLSEHALAGLLAEAAQESIQIRIVERPRQYGHRVHLERMHQRVDFPESEVSGKQQHTPALLMCRDHALRSLEIHAREHVGRPHRAELQQHHQQTPEMRKHLAGDALALPARSQREGGLQVLHRQASVRTVEEVERASDDRSCGEHGAQGQAPDETSHTSDSGVLETMAE